MNLRDQVIRTLQGGPIVRSVILSKLGTSSPDRVDLELGDLITERLVAVRNLRYYLIEQPEPDKTPAKNDTKATEGNDMESKDCKKCGVTKPLEDFPKNAGCKGGHTPTCKPCTYAAKKKTPAQTSAPAAKNGGGGKVAKPKKPRKAAKTKRLYLRVRRADGTHSDWQPTGSKNPATEVPIPVFLTELNDILPRLGKLHPETLRQLKKIFAEVDV